MINQYPRALESLEKAFRLNQRSAFIALRLASTYENEGKSDEAINALESCLDANPSEKNVHFRLAMLLIRHKRDKEDLIEHHLSRSFTKGDRNYAAQLWYARQLYLKEILKMLMIFF